MKGKVNKTTIETWVAATLIFLQIEPYFVWPLHQYIIYYNTVPLMYILFSHSDFKRITQYEYFFVFLAVLAAICARYNILGIGMSALLVLLFICKKSFLIDVFLKFRKIYVFFIGLSMIVWILLLLGVNVPYQTIQPLNSLKEYTCNAYPFLVKINMYSASYESLSNSIRFMGLFDEPGVVGTISLMMMYVGKFDLRTRANKILLLSGIFSFSLFFFVGALAFLEYKIFATNQKKSQKVLLTTLLLSLIAYSFYNPITSELIWDRLEWDSSRNTISGYNRSGDELDEFVEKIEGTSAYYWGVGDTKKTSEFSGAASIKNALLRYGLVVIGLVDIIQNHF